MNPKRRDLHLTPFISTGVGGDAHDVADKEIPEPPIPFGAEERVEPDQDKLGNGTKSVAFLLSNLLDLCRRWRRCS
jgi:hypothetical protein